MWWSSFLAWMEQTPLSVTIRESQLLFPFLEGLHVLALALSVGTIVALDLRLLGWGLRRTRVTTIFEQLRPWSLAGFVVMFVTGILLFWSEPVKVWGQPSFVIKMVLLGVLGVNALVFDRGIYPQVGTWDAAETVPARARFAGATSLLLWFAVISLGRWTAYF